MRSQGVLEDGKCYIEPNATPTFGPAHRSFDSEAVPIGSTACSGKDVVQLSKAAQATLAALQEARETPTQTAKEASHGDLQARRLLAKEAAKESVDK